MVFLQAAELLRTNDPNQKCSSRKNKIPHRCLGVIGRLLNVCSILRMICSSIDVGCSQCGSIHCPGIGIAEGFWKSLVGSCPHPGLCTIVDVLDACCTVKVECRAGGIEAIGCKQICSPYCLRCITKMYQSSPGDALQMHTRCNILLPCPLQGSNRPSMLLSHMSIAAAFC